MSIYDTYDDTDQEGYFCEKCMCEIDYLTACTTGLCEDCEIAEEQAMIDYYENIYMDSELY